MSQVTSRMQFDSTEIRELVSRYPSMGPRYTSYPTAVDFVDGFGEADLARSLDQPDGADPAGDLSIYLHLPFCQHLCFYCGCNKVLTRNRERGIEYLDVLYREMDLWRARLGGARRVRQFHLGGGTPTFFDSGQIRSLVEQVGRRFSLDHDDPDHDFSIEIDPRTVDTADVGALADIGFNRFSIGVQDFDPDVQKAVHRVQDAGHIAALVAGARSAGVRSINFDLIYGLPLQTVGSFRRTIEQVIECLPDRLSIYQYAHLPERFAPQRRIDAATLPSVEDRLALQQLTIDMLSEAGYVHIGMDHFALPNDPLVKALDDGSLRRSFQGYTTHSDCELLGMGVSAIGELGDCLYQNRKDLPAYYAAVNAGHLPLERGIAISKDDRVRRAVIMDIMCHGKVDKVAFAAAHGMTFEAAFPEAREGLTRMAEDGLVESGERLLSVTPRGRFLVRNVAMLFDRYRGTDAPARFSRTV